MATNSGNRVYIGTINPGGSISNSGSGPIRARPYTTPAAPGRSSHGSTNNGLTILSSHPTSSKNTTSPPDEDLVMIEEELSSMSSASSPTPSRRSSRSEESISSVSVSTPVRPAPAIPLTPKKSEGRSSTSEIIFSPSIPSPLTSSTPGRTLEADAPSPKKAKPIIETSKVRKVADRNGTQPQLTKNIDADKKDKSSSKQKVSNSSTGSGAVAASSVRSSEVKKRPATASVVPSTKPKCVSLGRKELIGKGSFGMVYKALDLDTNRLLAVKEIPLDGPNLQQLPTVRREIVLMEKLSHPNIVQCFGHDLDDQYLRIYMEFVAGGCVSSLLKNFGCFQERQASIVTKQVLAGLQYLHNRKIAHRDLKGDNILLQPDGTVKLADFGTARELATTAMSLAGTAYFMAPEMIKGTGHGLEADIWSVGCCIIEMLTGRPPFSHLVNQYAIMSHIAESKGPYDDAFPKNASPGVIKILKQCLVREPSKRATCAELLKEDWIVNPPTNAEMKGPLILELSTVSEIKERFGQKKGSNSAANSTKPETVKSLKGTTREAQPLSSFNPMEED